MNKETFSTIIQTMGGPLSAARSIVKSAGFGNAETLRVEISRKINGHEAIRPLWAAVINLQAALDARHTTED